MLNFSVRLKDLRKERNLRQTDLADELNLARTTVANYEQNTRFPDEETLCKFADYFDVSLDYLLGRTDLRKNHHDLFKKNPSVLLIIDPATGKIVDFSNGAIAFYGYTKDELMQKYITDINILAAPTVFAAMSKTLNEEQKTFCFEHRLASGEIRDVEVYSGPITIEGSVFLYSIVQDITYIQQVEDRVTKMLEAFLTMLHFRSPYAAVHAKRVASLSTAIAQGLDLPEEFIETLKMAAIAHDIGMNNVPTEIINKPGKFKPSEYQLVKEHVYDSYLIVSKFELDYPVADIILQHHERLDGSGYPKGLHKSEILTGAKILAVADTVEAMSFDRPYRKAPGIAAALEEIERLQDVKYDANVVAACVLLFREKGFTFG